MRNYTTQMDAAKRRIITPEMKVKADAQLDKWFPERFPVYTPYIEIVNK